MAASALILAGGSSKRFGQPKALAEVEGRPMITRVAAALQLLTTETIVSTAEPSLEDRIRSLLPSAVFARDLKSGRGPIEGLHRGCQVAKEEIVLVAPCDAPFLRTDLYRLLLEVLGSRAAAAPKLDVLDPVRAVYRRESAIRALTADPDLASPSALLDRLKPAILGADQIRTVDPELLSFLDVNTHRDLDEALLKNRWAGTRAPGG